MKFTTHKFKFKYIKTTKGSKASYRLLKHIVSIKPTRITYVN